MLRETNRPKPSLPAPHVTLQGVRVVARHILVVDDGRDNVESLALLLRLKGHEVQTAYDGLEALEAAAHHRPEVVLLDLSMPKLDGYAVCQRIRAQPWGKAMTIIALSGWGQDEHRRQAEAAGFDRHLVKPVELATLLELLSESHRRPSGETRSATGEQTRSSRT